MSPAVCRGAVLASLLVALAMGLAPRAHAAPSDGSTLFADRSTSPMAPDALPMQPDLFTGAAVTEIPLEMPPGTGGLTPSLALRYTSADRGESWVGAGWSLSLPAITRSLERGVPRYEDDDLFELDGRKLVPESDTPALPRRYHGRRERFERIVHEADGSWTVTVPGGTRRRFGLAPEARLERADGTPFAWLLSEEEDVHGNAIAVHYDRSDAGTAYPAEIRYTLRRSPGGGLDSLDGDATRDRLVRFSLEPRPDVSTSYAAGFERVLAHRLRAVHVTLGSERLRCWELGYAESPDSFRSLLVSVSHQGTDGACDGTAPATPPFVTRMTYRTNAGADPPRTGWEGPVPFDWPPGLSLVGAGQEDTGVRLGDVDGDGRPDLVKALAVSAPGQSVDGYVRSGDSGVHRNTGSAFESGASPSFALPAVAGEIGALTTSFARAENGLSFGTGLSLLDLDGDGRADLAGGVRWLDYASGSTATYGIGGLQHNTGRGFVPASDYGDLLQDDRWALARYGLIDFRWSWNGSGWWGSFESRTLPGPARFADLTGDGLPELVIRGTEIHSRYGGSAPPFYPGSPSCSFALSSYHFRNEGGLRFLRSAVSDFAVTSDLCGTSATLRLAADFQPCDPFDPSCQRRLIHDEARAQRFLADGSYAHWNLHWELGNEEVDLNGDGLADTVSAAYDLVLGSESLAAGLNAGAGGFAEAPAWRLPAHLYEIGGSFARDLGVRMADVNGDGRVDVVQAVEGGARLSWLSDGRAGPGPGPAPWRRSSAWEAPPSLAFVSGSGQDLGLRLVDVDGDGMLDLVRSRAGTNEVYRNRGAVPDLLETLTTPLGARTTWRYVPSTRFDHTGNTAAPFEPPVSDGTPHLPQVLQLVESIEVASGSSPVARIGFAYEGGLFEPASRELRGFRKVTATRDDGRVTVTHFFQDEARAGLVEREDVFSSGTGGRRWRSVAYRYTPAAAPPFVSLLARRVETEHDDPSSPRTVASSFRYDAFGNLVERIDWGEVASPDGDVLSDLVPGDTRTTEVEYATGPLEPAAYVVDRVRRQRVRQGLPATGRILRETLYRYDGDTTGNAWPTRGLLTRRTDVLVPGTTAGPTTTFGYDAYGNLLWTRDPRANAGQGGGTTLYGVDPRWHAFRTSVTNALGHVSTARTQSPADCAAYPAGAGVVQEERGPNLAPAEPGLRRCLDAFGRVVRERAPLDLAESRWIHTDVPGSVRVERRDRTSGGGERGSVTFLDGLGRVLAVRSDGPGGRPVLSARSYDAQGRLATETALHFEGDPEPVTRFAYDVLDRPVRVELPAARVSTLAYGRGRITRTRATGITRTQERDPFGNVVRVEESGHATTYAYDALDHLVSIRDPGGNLTSIFYDALGRRTALLDPDTGATGFPAYDDDGNLLTRIDALGTTSWTYDAIGRPLTRRAGSSEVRFGYDTAVRGKGLLATRSDDAGLLRVWSYDGLGRLEADSQEVGGTTLFFLTRYDALGGLASRTFPDGRVLTFDHDAAGFLTGVRSSGSSVAGAVAWDARGRLASWTAGNGVVTSSGFDPVTGRLDTIRVDQGATALEDLAYGFDPDDRVKSIRDRRPGGLAPRNFFHDPFDRLLVAQGPYGPGLASASVRYSYDAAGNLTCKDAAMAAGCAGGTAMVYPATSGSHPAHAPATVGGVAARYDLVGNLVSLGTRAYAYDTLGRLVSASESGLLRAAHVYDADGRRVAWVDHAGPRVSTTRFVRSDFAWDVTRGLGRIEVGLGGQPIATLVAPFRPRTGTGAAPAAAPGEAPRSGLGPLAPALLATLGASLALGCVLVARRRRGLLRPALAGTAALLIQIVAPAVAAHPDGDLNTDGHLDAADALLAERIATGSRLPGAAELEHGDVAPLESAPQVPSRVDAGDLVLIWRALRGEDVDGDGLDRDAELAMGASPFRADTDRDGLGDALEKQLGTHAGVSDTDGDGVRDGDEVTAGTDPFARDTDGDGLEDGSDPEPLRGIVYRHGDHLGSTVLVTKASGSGEALVLSRTVYRPYGEAVGAAPPERGFDGRRRDAATGLYDFGARWYDPSLGRFLQPDPLVPDALHPASLNRYAYAANAPVDRVDPSGHASLSFHVFAGTIGPGGFSGAGVDLGVGLGAGGTPFQVDPWLAFEGTQVRLRRPAPGALGFQSVLTSPYPSDPSGVGARGRAYAERSRLARANGLAPIELRALTASDLRPGDVLLTGDQQMASWIRGTDYPDLQAGHAALVLDVRGELVEVLSADNHGKYTAWSTSESDGSRSWAVLRPRDPIDPEKLQAHVRSLHLYDGFVLGSDAYLRNLGGNVCSSTVADALEASGASPVSRVGNLVTPHRLRDFGSVIGRIDIPIQVPAAP